MFNTTPKRAKNEIVGTYWVDRDWDDIIIRIDKVSNSKTLIRYHEELYCGNPPKTKKMRLMTADELTQSFEYLCSKEETPEKLKSL